MRENQQWRARAACYGLPVDLFYPEQGEISKAKQAQRICRECPVRIECLEDVLADDEHSDLFGIRGGLSPKRRRGLRAKRARMAEKPSVSALRSLIRDQDRKPILLTWDPERNKYVCRN